MDNDKLSALDFHDETTQKEFLQELKDLGVPISPVSRPKEVRGCSRDTNGDGDCGRRGCPECGGGPRQRAEANARLRPDDEDMIADAVAWGNEKKVGQKGIMVLIHLEHKRAVIQRLKEEGFRPIQSDNLEAPNGAKLFVRTSGDMMSGTSVDRLWIHEDCPPRVAQALYPCLKKHA